MKIEKIIIDAVNLTRTTKLPVLFMSNPGLGKTTILGRYAKENGMHLETLIGSRFSPEEISGYMVNNGGEHLQHMSPEWFARIQQKNKEGIPTLLFIDELSTCSEAVQGSLLSLIFDRTIGNGKLLPDNCIIVSAANYASNLCTSMNILSPTLNRFAIINLNEGYTALDMAEEFLSEPEDYTSLYKLDNYSKLTEDQKSFFINSYKNFWKDTFIKYCDPESAIGILDVSNQVLDGIYAEAEGSVYNFISGRSLSYLQRFLIGYLENKTDNKDLLYKLIDGLVGGGTYSFKEEKQTARFRNYLHKSMDKLLLMKKKEKKSLPELTNNVSKDVAAYLIGKENLDISPSDEVLHMVNLVEEISNRFKPENIIDVKTPEEIASFTSDFEAVVELQQYSSQYPTSSNITNSLTKIGMDYYALYSSILGTEMDFAKTFGLKSNLFSQVCILRLHSGKIIRAAMRITDRFTKPVFYEIKKDCTLLEANLKDTVHTDAGIEILIFDNGFKFISYDNFTKLRKKAA